MFCNGMQGTQQVSLNKLSFPLVHFKLSPCVFPIGTEALS